MTRVALSVNGFKRFLKVNPDTNTAAVITPPTTGFAKYEAAKAPKVAKTTVAPAPISFLVGRPPRIRERFFLTVLDRFDDFCFLLFFFVYIRCLDPPPVARLLGSFL